ncbi:MAG: DUF3095 family protein [Maribacter sp.]
METTKASNHSFYRDLPLHQVTLEALYANATFFAPLPDDWYVLVADVKDSTAAITSQHNEVNLAATGCIVAVLNSLKETEKDRIPYFFGGDGATFLIPNTYKDQLIDVLNLQKEHVKLQWNLNLVVGYMTLADVYNEGFNLNLARIQLNEYLQIPVVLGLGLKYAEDLVKRTFSAESSNPSEPVMPDLEGMECRWDKIAPPTTDRSVICLLVYCDNEQIQSSVYHEVLSQLTSFFGNLEERQPISTPKLKLDATFNKIKREMIASIGRYSFRYLLRKVFDTYIGKVYFKYSKEGRLYLQMTKELAETVMIDGLINTILVGTNSQMKSLSSYLDELEKSNKIIYGIHITHSSIMSCYVEDRKHKHAHFIDGTEGGYTKAAEMLKTKFP